MRPGRRLCRYVNRPPIKLERLSLAPDGKVIYALRRRWRDGTSAIQFEPLDFLARLAALVPRPRAHLLTYHGVLAPAAKWREFIVPRSPSSADGAQGDLHGEQPLQPNYESPPTANARPPKRRTRSTWAELMLRAFSIDVLTCPHCGGLRELIAFLTDGLVVPQPRSRRGAPLGDPFSKPPLEASSPAAPDQGLPPRAPRAPDGGAEHGARASAARVRVRGVEGRILHRAS